MKVVGFTIVRNAIKLDYPVVESIQSILPFCDEVLVAVGRSEDDTLNLVRSINSDKIRIIETVWDDRLRQGGRILAVETNKAFDLIPHDANWCFYIQADEVLHEKYIPKVKRALQTHLEDKNVEGLLFKYQHFYGSYEYIGDSRKWYRREIRIIRNDKRIRSYRDAQGFRKNNKKLKVKLLDAYMYHYGWVKAPWQQQLKRRSFYRFWYSDEWIQQHISTPEFDYSQIDSLKKFEESHPKVMLDRISKMDWQFEFDPSHKQYTLRDRLLMGIEKWTGYRLWEYKNYDLLK